MSHIHLIRHAESEVNVTSHIIGGRTNSTNLTQLGEKQSDQLGDLLVHLDISPTNIYVSPAIRTIETARISFKKAGIKTTTYIEDSIQELDQGIFTGKERVLAYTPEVLQKIREQGKDFKFPEGESMNDVSKRMHNWLTRILKDSKKTDIILAYSHGIAIKCLLASVFNWNHAQIYETVIDNASLTTLSCDNGNFLLERLNQTGAEHT